MNWNDVFRMIEKPGGWTHPPFSYLGCGFKFCWLFWFAGQAEGALSGFPLAYQMLFAVGQIGGYLLVMALFKRMSPYSKNAGSVILSYLVLIVGSCLLAFHGALPLPSLAWAALITIITMASVFTMILWLEIYACFPSRHSIQIYAESLILSIFIWVIVVQLPEATANLIACLLPVALALTWVVSYRSTPESTLPLESPSLPRLPRRLMLWMGLVYFSFNFGYGMVGETWGSYTTPAGQAIPAVLVVVGLSFLPSRFDFKTLGMLSLVFITGGISLLYASFHGIATGVFMAAGRECCILLSYITICSIAYRGRISPAYCAAAVTAIGQIGNAIGYWLADSLVMADAAVYSSPMLLLLFAAVVLATLLVLSQQESLLGPQAASSPVEEQGAGRTPAFVSASGLSAREREIFGLLLEGMSQGEIAERLVIAPGTVRAHVSNIYKKLDVHSREEFDALCWSKGLPSSMLRD